MEEAAYTKSVFPSGRTAGGKAAPKTGISMLGSQIGSMLAPTLRGDDAKPESRQDERISFRNRNRGAGRFAGTLAGARRAANAGGEGRAGQLPQADLADPAGALPGLPSARVAGRPPRRDDLCPLQKRRRARTRVRAGEAGGQYRPRPPDRQGVLDA